MNNFEVYDTKARVLEDNEAVAQQVKDYLKEHHVFFINLMASPGSGKTTTLLNTINALKDEFRIGVMEADVDSDVDARSIAETGAKVIQLHTGGSCHMDADQTMRGLLKMGVDDIDVLILENVGNLVCPAEFNIGENLKVMILSVPEGDDKPLKYPLMFTVSDVMLENKMDVLPVFDYNADLAEERVRKLNPDIQCFRISSLKGEGTESWNNWLRNRIREYQNEGH